MSVIKGLGNFFALDIGSSVVRVAQLTRHGGGWVLQKFAYVPIDEKTALSGSATSGGANRLGEAIMTALGQSGIKDKDVVLGISSSKTFATVIDVQDMPEAELNNAIKYQIDQYIPMNIDEAKVDWAVLGYSRQDNKKKEVLLTSVSKKYIEDRLEFVESLGLNVIAAEPDGIAVARATLPSGLSDARLILDIGESNADLIITFLENPRLVRSIPTGVNSLVKSIMQNLNVSNEQARQFLLKFGLMPDKLEGQVVRSVSPVVENFANEVVKSIKFFQGRYPEVPIGGLLLSGFAAVIPQFSDFITAQTGVPATIANPWQRVKVSDLAQQQLTPYAFEFATVIGLAQREGSK